ncbi:sulfate permease, partial [Aphelenchoides avenae]
ELYALGIASTISSLFPVYPFGAALSRSTVCEMAGAKTQLNAFFSSILLFVVILYAGPLLNPLPMAVLVCIVMVSLKNLLLQVRDLPKFWSISRFDAAIWLVSFWSTVIIDVQTGLFVSIGFVLLTVVLREQWPKMHSVSATKDLEMFKPSGMYKGLTSLPPNVTILRFEAPLHFASAERFCDKLTAHFVKRDVIPDSVNVISETIKEETGPSDSDRDLESKAAQAKKTLIVDGSCIPYVDAMGAEALREAYKDGAKVDVRVVFAELTGKLDVNGVAGFLGD